MNYYFPVSCFILAIFVKQLYLVILSTIRSLYNFTIIKKVIGIKEKINMTFSNDLCLHQIGTYYSAKTFLQ